MKTYFDLPLEWRDDGYGRGLKKIADILIPNIGRGNYVSGYFGGIELRGRPTVPPDGSQWIKCTIKYTMCQGFEENEQLHVQKGDFVPNGGPYTIKIPISEPIKGDVSVYGYAVKVEDVNGVFHASSATLSDKMPFTLNYATAETPRDIQVNGSKVYEDIVVTWTQDSANQAELELWQGSKMVWKSRLSSEPRIVIPHGTLKTLDNCIVKVRTRFVFLGNVYWSDYVSTNLDGLETVQVTKPSGFEMQSNKIYENIRVTWKHLQSHEFYSSLFINEQERFTKKWSSDNFIDIPYGTITSRDDSIKLKVKSRVNINGYITESEQVSYTLSSLQELKAETPKDVRLVGAQQIIEQPIKIAWTNTDTSNVYCRIELWQNGMKIHDKSNILSTEYTIPPGTIQSVNQVQIRVYNVKTVNGYVAESAYGSMTLSNLQSYKPAIRDFSLNGKNRDYDIIVTPDVDRGDVFSLLINGVTKINSLTIPKGTLKPGSNTIRLIVTANDSIQLPVTSEYEKIIDGIVEDVPIVYSLEPNSINTNIEKSNEVTFSINEFCDSWQLIVNGNRYKSGTTERSVFIPTGMFRLGQNTITLQVSYQPKYSGATKRAGSRTSTFNGYGKPKLPKLDSTTVYNTATPTFTWTCYDNDESNIQTEVEIIVKTLEEQTIIESRTLNQSETSYKITKQLSNKTQYIVSISIRNKYGLWSDYASKGFETSFTSLPTPELNIVKGINYVTIECSVFQDPKISELRLFKKEKYGDWVCIAQNLSCYDTVKDYTIKSNIPTQYKVQAHTLDGGYNESLVKETIISYDGFIFSNVEKIDKTYKTLCCDVSIKHNKNIVNKVFSGNSLPDIYYDNTNYMTGEFNIQINSNDLYLLEDMIYNGEVFCYRDWRGRKIYCSIVIETIDYVKFSNIYNVSLSFTQVNFTEENMYSKGVVNKIAYLDGTYRLDGSLYLDGYIMDKRGEVFVYL